MATVKDRVLSCVREVLQDNNMLTPPDDAKLLGKGLIDFDSLDLLELCNLLEVEFNINHLDHRELIAREGLTFGQLVDWITAVCEKQNCNNHA